MTASDLGFGPCDTCRGLTKRAASKWIDQLLSEPVAA
jgi:hypothetical protein